MKSAYLYVRVSTDEQRRRGYSLPEQEDRLLKYCEFNDIAVKGIFREDYSAKDFNRPEWKKLFSTLKKSRSGVENNILFIKWDRFSRSIEYAYEMIGLLRRRNTTAMAIDQPIDFSVPESTVMLAVCLSIPEAENSRRALNTSRGMRRAKLMGRYANKAPMGYANLTAPDGKKCIAPQQPEADLIKWSFQQLAKNAFQIEEVRRMANAKGLKCSRSRFWKLIRCPVYCGYIPLSATSSEDAQLIKGIHEALIPEALFNEVQSIINSRRKIVSKTYGENETFMLRGYLICPLCHKKLTGSFSKGKYKRYPYYHCAGCYKTRFKAEILNATYEEKLNKLKLSPAVANLFNLILKDMNMDVQRELCLRERKQLLNKIEEQDSFISNARKLYVNSKIRFDDFSNIKSEYQVISDDLRNELKKVIIKLTRLEKQSFTVPLDDIFSRFSNLDVAEKKHMVDLIPPVNLDPHGNFSLQINSALSRAVTIKTIASIIR